MAPLCNVLENQYTGCRSLTTIDLTFITQLLIHLLSYIRARYPSNSLKLVLRNSSRTNFLMDMVLIIGKGRHEYDFIHVSWGILVYRYLTVMQILFNLYNLINYIISKYELTLQWLRAYSYSTTSNQRNDATPTSRFQVSYAKSILLVSRCHYVKHFCKYFITQLCIIFGQYGSTL